MILIRKPESIYRARGEIDNGNFSGRWHFSFGDYDDPDFRRFGALRVLNDDILSKGAVWPLHPHKNIEVVTYCVDGEFRHADENGLGGILKKGWVQHTTMGSGLSHSEINNSKKNPMRFLQMWFMPDAQDLLPSVKQKQVENEDRLNKIFPLVSNSANNALKIHSDASVFSCLLEAGHDVYFITEKDRGVYVYILEGGPVKINGYKVYALSAAMMRDEKEISLKAFKKSEIILIEVGFQ